MSIEDKDLGFSAQPKSAAGTTDEACAMDNLKQETQYLDEGCTINGSISDLTTKGDETLQPTGVESNIRRRFERLTAAEQSAATAISDDLFLQVLVAKEPSATTTKQSKKGTNLSSPSGGGGGSNKSQKVMSYNWEKAIDLGQISELFSSANLKSMPKKLSNNNGDDLLASVSDDHTDAVEICHISGSEVSVLGPKDEFRIRNANSKDDDSDSVTLGLSEREILDKIQVIFPSVLHRAIGDAEMGTKSPVLIIPPVAMATNQMLDSLDRLSHSVFGDSFLSIESISVCASRVKWYDRLRHSRVLLQNGTVPSYAIYLARLEEHIVSCFLQHDEDNKVVSPSSSDAKATDKADVVVQESMPQFLLGGNNVETIFAFMSEIMDYQNSTANTIVTGMVKSSARAIGKEGVTAMGSLVDLVFCTVSRFYGLQTLSSKRLGLDKYNTFIRDLLKRIDDAKVTATKAVKSKTASTTVASESTKATKTKKAAIDTDAISNEKQQKDQSESGKRKKNKKKSKKKKKQSSESKQNNAGKEPAKADVEVGETPKKVEIVQSVPTVSPSPDTKADDNASKESDESDTSFTEQVLLQSSINKKLSTKMLGNTISFEAKLDKLDSLPAVVNKDMVEAPKEVKVEVAEPQMNNDEPKAGTADTDMVDDNDEWETVGGRSRMARKKPAEKSHSYTPASRGNNRSNTSSNNNSSTNNSNNVSSNNDSFSSGNKKGKNKTSGSRKKNASKKVAKEIIGTVLDKVDEKVKEKAKHAAKAVVPSQQGSVSTRAATNAWGKIATTPANNQNQSVGNDEKPSTLRDVVLGRHAKKDYASALKHPGNALTTAATAGVIPAVSEYAADSKNRQTSVKSEGMTNEAKDRSDSFTVANTVPGEFRKTSKSDKTGDIPKDSSKTSVRSAPTSPKKTKNKTGSSADQNTAPTYQETVSAVSGATNNREVLPQPVQRSDKAVTETKDQNNVDQPIEVKDSTTHSPPSSKDVASEPPLPTLLSPGNVNSATSSVASSLEVPHSNHRVHHHDSVPDVNDVGYHLLDVCNRLSRDMAEFMHRRGQSLKVRRKERGILLNALQDTLSELWPGTSQVELYGSCATLLDLPSSDLDVVVLKQIAKSTVTVDTKKSVHKQATSDAPVGKKSEKMAIQNGSDGNKDEAKPAGQSKPYKSSSNLASMDYIPNSEKVKILAAELEKKPWAVRVRAIPTASVPVVKILADPSKIQTNVPIVLNSTENNHKPPTPAEPRISVEADNAKDSSAPIYQPWRGADVMNGLLSLDITFEGPEHGGLGSTHLSNQILSEISTESGLAIESTPFVQVLMVLKEMLAQRKLNEPYSGGLSSYALLLLLLALYRERALIREEIERFEQQRKAVAQESSSQSNNTQMYYHQPEGSKHADDRKGTTNKQNVQNNPSSTTNDPSPSSWVGVAKSMADNGAMKTKSSDRTTSEAMNVVDNKSPVFSATPAEQSRHDNTGTITDVARNEGSTSSQDMMNFHNAPPFDPNSGEYVNYQQWDADGNYSPPSFYQGFNDIIEVLCSGEVTAGKLLMHFLLFYGQYFDSQATAIDLSGKHERAFIGLVPYYAYQSPYIHRRSTGTIDPYTGMLTVDPIIVYDPLEGAENNNVSKRCFCWNNVRWIFGQSYATLSSAVERSATPPSTPGVNRKSAHQNPLWNANNRDGSVTNNTVTQVGDTTDPASPLLSCLLSF